MAVDEKLITRRSTLFLADYESQWACALISLHNCLLNLRRQRAIALWVTRRYILQLEPSFLPHRALYRQWRAVKHKL